MRHETGGKFRAAERRGYGYTEISLSPTTLDGRYSLRICIVNFRTRRVDIDWLVEHVLAFGREAHAASG